MEALSSIVTGIAALLGLAAATINLATTIRSRPRRRDHDQRQQAGVKGVSSRLQ